MYIYSGMVIDDHYPLTCVGHYEHEWKPKLHLRSVGMIERHSQQKRGAKVQFFC